MHLTEMEVKSKHKSLYKLNEDTSTSQQLLSHYIMLKFVANLTNHRNNNIESLCCSAFAHCHCFH